MLIQDEIEAEPESVESAVVVEAEEVADVEQIKATE